MTEQKPPGRIYLQADSSGGYEIGRDATWCDHRINDEDVEYQRTTEPSEEPDPLGFIYVDDMVHLQAGGKGPLPVPIHSDPGDDKVAVFLAARPTEEPHA